MKNTIRIIAGAIFCGMILSSPVYVFGQCYPLQAKTAAFATGGSSPYKNNVLWLTWGSTLADVAAYPYGKPNTTLANGASSYASIDLGGGRFLCLEATISNLSGDNIKSYSPGNYVDDSMDNLYNIGGINTNNKLVSGIINGTYGGATSFTVTCKATIDNAPVKLIGMVVGDAESLAITENFSVTASGHWNVVELQKNLGTTLPYEIRKVLVGSNVEQIQFVKGNDNNTAAITFLTFNTAAYSATDFSVSFDVKLKGAGLTAVSFGVLPPQVDGGDAPASYGSPLHTIDALAISSDGIAAGSSTAPTINLNTASATTGSLVPPTGAFLGSKGPDGDVSALFSKNANGDNLNGNAGLLEEDCWPAIYTRFSYKTYYKPGDVIKATIPYVGVEDAYISGWIDFNLNGVFEDSERASVFAPANQTSQVLSWTVPAKAVPRSTYVRLRYAKNQIDILSPTAATPGGEVEDHKIYILRPLITNPMLPSKSKY